MARLNLTLDADTQMRLGRYAGRRPQATVARDLIRQALDAQERLSRQRKLARDYSAGRGEGRELLTDFEPLSLEVLGEDRD